MNARFALMVLVAVPCLAQDSLEGLARKHARERASVARVSSRAVAARELAAVLGRQAEELRRYAEGAPVASAALARQRAERAELDSLSLLLESDPAIWEPRLQGADEERFALLVARAACESQEKLVAVLGARAASERCPERIRARIGAAKPGALLLEGSDARALGVSWGRVELLLDREGRLRGVDLAGDERENLLRELKR